MATEFKDPFSNEVWSTTYKDHTDNTIDDTLMRVATYVASAEVTEEKKSEWQDKFFDLLSNFKCTAGGRIYANAGTEYGGTTMMNCISAETLVHTANGLVRADNISAQSIKLLTTNGIFEDAVWNSYGKQQLYAITFANGEVIHATEGHQWLVTNPQTGKIEKVTTKFLVNRNVPLNGIVDYKYTNDQDYYNGIKNGLVFGDGYTYTDFTNGPKWSALQQFGDSRHLVVDYFGYTNVTFYKGNPEGIHFVSGLQPELKAIPPLTKSRDYLRGFLAGVIAADGHVDKNGSVMLHTCNYDYAEQLRSIAVTCGIPVVSLRVERAGASYSKFANEDSKLWKLTFVKKYFQQDKRLVLKNSHKQNMANSPASVQKSTIKCVSVESTDRIEEVYCCDQPTTHTFTIGSFGLITGNCFVSPRPTHHVDSLPSILQDILNQCQTLKAEGGWGQNFSWIRPRGTFIKGIGVETPGAVKYMEVYDKTSDVITSGSGRKSDNVKAKSKIRKGAMMGVMDCLAGNTPINTIEGKVAIKDLVGKNPYLYCTDQKGNVFVRQALKVWSKGTKKTIKIVFDNDSIIECTPEHEIMLSDGTYKKAQDLMFNDSVAVLNKRLINNYLHLSFTGSRKLIAEHNAVYEMVYGEYPTILTEKRSPTATVAHHVDHVKWNNHPENIQQMSLREHSIHHSDLLKRFQTERAASQKGTTWDEFYGEEKAAEIRTKYTAKRKGSIPWNKGMNFSQAATNHKVVRIEESIEQEVFDISMPDYHNFVANDIFVHNCWHPDIIEFITAKQQPGRLTKFNVSVNCTDEFMSKILKVRKLKSERDMMGKSLSHANLDDFKGIDAAIAEADQWELRFPDVRHSEYDNVWTGDLRKWEDAGLPTVTYRTVSATWLWNLIMESTYNRAEPGVLFLDRANYFGPLNYLETIYATNPCGEQTLAPGGVCNLGSLNLTQFVNADRTGFDLVALKKYTRYLNRFLDNINSLSMAPLPEYLESMRKKRRVGIGILGWGSALFLLKVRLGSEKANEFREQVMSTIAREAYMSSIDLAEEKGMFELCIPEKHAIGVFVKSLDLPESYMNKLHTVGIRNSSLLSIQPTGNTSILANVVSGGLEPVFMPEYVRTVIVGDMPEEIAEVTPKWFEGAWNETELFKFTKEGDEQILRGVHNGTVYKIDRNRGLTKEVLCQDYSVRQMKELHEWDPKADWAVTTTNLSVKDHINDLTGFARWVDSAMSKTVNVPNNYSVEDFKNIYLEAYQSGYVKGVTTYRAGTMTTVLAAKEEKETEEEIIKEDVKLPDSSPATIKVLKAEQRKWYVTVVYYESNRRPFALFVQTNDYEKAVVAEEAVELLIKLARKKGIPKRHLDKVIEKIEKDNNVNKTARLLSFLLRHGVLIKNIVAQLDKVESAYVGTFVFAIKKFLSSYVKDGESVEDEKCLECGSDKIIFSEGCKKCISCGSSKCG